MYILSPSNYSKHLTYLLQLLYLHPFQQSFTFKETYISKHSLYPSRVDQEVREHQGYGEGLLLEYSTLYITSYTLLYSSAMAEQQTQFAYHNIQLYKSESW